MKRILITGASGYIGKQLASHLSDLPDCEVIGLDRAAPSSPFSWLTLTLDIRDPALSQVMTDQRITHVVHLASIVDPGKNPALEYDIDVNGTANVLAACAEAEVRHLTVSSSGAAYGYHADNPQWLTEAHALRGNDEFSYSRHKRLVEEMLADFRRTYPQIAVLTLRLCTVLGSNTRNRITDLFERKKLLAVGHTASPFVFVWDQDVVNALTHGVSGDVSGEFNLAGDGKLSVEDLARITGKPIQRLPAYVLRVALWLGKILRLTHAGPEQLKFLQYRPVLDNAKLKREFGYTPQKTSEQAFTYFWQHRQSI